MWHARRTLLASLLASLVLVAGLAAASAAPATTSTSHSGTTSDGGSWVADVPSPWNGTVLLYSHGFGPPQAADAPDPSTKQALLDRGYALVGSSYDPNGSWWALGSALRDQFEALDAVRAILPSKPSRGHRLRHVDGWPDQRAGERARQRAHRWRAHHVRPRRRSDPPQQLPTGRRVRARQAAGARRCRSSSCASPTPMRAWPPASSSTRSHSRRRARPRAARAWHWRWPS